MLLPKEELKYAYVYLIDIIGQFSLFYNITDRALTTCFLKSNLTKRTESGLTASQGYAWTLSARYRPHH